MGFSKYLIEDGINKIVLEMVERADCDINHTALKFISENKEDIAKMSDEEFKLALESIKEEE